MPYILHTLKVRTDNYETPPKGDVNTKATKKDTRVKLNRHPACFIAILLFGLLTPAPAIAQGPFALLHSLFDLGPNPHANARQGWRVAVDGNIAVVGVPQDNSGATQSGAVRVFDVATGALQHTLTNPHPTEYAFFGDSVAISGTWVVVGACSDDTGAENAGSAYVYDLAGTTPIAPVATLNKPSPASNDFFGFSVAISGTRVAVGA